VLRLAARTIHQAYVGSRALVRLRRGEGTIDVRGSLFCGVRDSTPAPLCGFYAALVTRFLELYNLPGHASVGECRAVGDRSCVLALTLNAEAEVAADTADEVEEAEASE
jgi:predicted hydrocarbon binding protein